MSDNIYKKLQRCRVELNQLNMTKSGNNKFAGHTYFELADFMPHVNRLFADNGLCGVVAYTADLATLTVYDADKPTDMIVFTSPMSSANLKGCHEVQQLGAVQTYLRRYLYTAALEIVEADALDSTQGKAITEPAAPPKLDDKCLKPIQAAATMDELKKAWEAVPVGLRSQYNAAKEDAKRRIGGEK